MRKKQITFCLAATIILCSACGFGKNQIEQSKATTEAAMIIDETLTVAAEKSTTAVSEESKDSKSSDGNKTNSEAKTEFKLTEKNKDFLNDMCRYLPAFTNPNNLSKTFWHDFLFHSYSGKGLGSKETQVKVSQAEVQTYVKQVLGLEMPAYEPTAKEKQDGQTSMYYQNGYYYIDVADFDDNIYRYQSMEIQKDDTISVIYQITNPKGTDLGTVEFLLLEETNENGFVVTAKIERRK